MAEALLAAFFTLVLLSPRSAVGQEAASFTVAGSVVSAEDGSSLPGVNIRVKGTDAGTVTNLDGEYSLRIPSSSDTLVFSFVGFEEQEIPVAGRSRIDVRLETDQLALDEVVVIGYGTVRRADLTGSVGSVKTGEIQELPITSVEQAIQGRAAGVQIVQNSGAPGGGFTVRIRGGNSMQGNNDPLYVVDGFPISIGGTEGRNILMNIAPGDIESIEVLKDASATAIYGARGANGVVMITTKRGRQGGRIEFESYIGTQEVTKKLDLLSPMQYAELINEMARNEKQAEPFDLNNLPGQTDWQDQIFRSAPIRNYALRINGGGEQTTYLVSGNYMNQDGVIQRSSYSRGTLRFNLNSDVNRRLRLSNQLMISRSTNSGVNTGNEFRNIVHNALAAPPAIPVYAEDGSYYNWGYLWFVPQLPRHPVVDINELMDETLSNRLLENFTAEYELLDGLKAKVLLGADYLDTKSDFYATRLHEEGMPAGFGQVDRGEALTYVNENTLSYDRVFNRNHRLSTVGGFTWEHQESSGLLVGANGFVTDILSTNNLGSATTVLTPDARSSDWTLMSWLGRINYTLYDRYLFTVSGRADGSSRFGSGNKWAFFPSVALAWRVSQEPFLKNVGAISDLKLRVSAGRTGSQAISPYQSIARVAPTTTAIGNGFWAGFAPSNIANPDLRWETTQQINAGFDVSLWSERLRFTADGYTKTTSDLLASVPLPASSGFGSILQNVGRIRNTGFELSFGVDPIAGPDLSWSVEGNVSVNRNEVLKLAGGNEFLAGSVSQNGQIHLIREGEPLAVFYGFQEDGLTEQGDIKYADLSGPEGAPDGLINDFDRVILGSPYPDFIGGLSTSMRFKGFDLSVLFQGSFGGELFNANVGYTAASLKFGENQVADLYGNYWTAANPDPNAKYPRLNRSVNFRPSDRFIEDASYLRLKTLRLGYSVPVRKIGVPGVNSLMVYASGQNLLTFTGYSWYDPEISQLGGNLQPGVDRYSYPHTRTYTIGLQLGL